MTWLRSPGILLLSCALMGSKLVLQTPGLNSAEEASAATDCFIDNSCESHIDERNAGDTRKTAPIAELNHFDEPESTLYAVESYTTTGPVVSELAIATSPDSPFAVSATHQQHYYEITGNNSREIWDQLRGSANPLSVRRGTGKKPFAEASWSYSYTYQPAFGASVGTCSIVSGNIHFEFNTVLPQLKDKLTKPQRIRTQWEKFHSVIAAHEADHHRIFQRSLELFPVALKAVNDVPCNELDARARLSIAAIENDISEASNAFDQLATHSSYDIAPSASSNYLPSPI